MTAVLRTPRHSTPCQHNSTTSNHENQFGGRARLSQLLIDEFTKDAELATNHELIADLPLGTVWTTNYDTLLEQAFERVYKRIDVKITQENLATTLPKRDVTIHRMHGDISQPASAVLVKDDYERYERDRPPFLLCSRVTLFLRLSYFWASALLTPVSTTS
jgi:hypothetical protein